MARPAEEPLVRRRRRAVIVAAALLAIPLGVAVRRSGDWATFGAAMLLVVVLMAFGTQLALGPWTRDDLPDGDPEDEGSPRRSSRRYADSGEQLVLPVQRRSGVHARHS